MTRAWRHFRKRRYRTLALLGAWIFLASQGVIAIPMACSAAMDASMARMDSMPTSEMPASAADTMSHCTHCHPHQGTAECLGINGCHAPSLAFASAMTLPSIVPVERTAPARASPRTPSLAFDPPLRPPAA